MTSNLPTLLDGWEWKKLADIAEKIFAGGDKPEKYSEIQTEEYNIPIYANGIKDNGLFGYTDIHKVEEECLTISARGTIGFSAVRNEKFFPIVRLIVLIPKKNILSAYLKYYFDSQITDNTGSSIPQLTVPMVKSKAIPLPPLEEQKRLVSLLDTLFAKIDRSIELLEENIAAADALLPSALNTVFGELEDMYEKKTLKEMVEILGDGLHGTPIYDENGDYFFINGANLVDGKIVIKENTKKVSIIEYEKYKKNLNSTTVLVSINGTIGNVALFNNEKCILGKSACFFNLKKDVNKFFMTYVIKNNHFQTYIRENATGSTISNVSLKTMREYQFPLPPLDIQTQTVAYLDSVRDKVEMLKKAQNDKKARLVALKASLLDRAFKGEL